MVIMDDYSRFPLVEIKHSLKAETVTKRLDTIFSIFGIPEEIRTDNGPPFNSSNFKEFSEHLGFHHRKITPLLEVLIDTRYRRYISILSDLRKYRF